MMSFDASTKSVRHDPAAVSDVSVEIGDSKDASAFHPQVKLSRWDNTSNISLRLTGDDASVRLVQPGDSSVSCDSGYGPLRFYEHAESDDHPSGAFEFEIVLSAIPRSPQFIFSVRQKDTVWYYQPPLTEEDKALGCQRPAHVEGSYAIYSTRHVGNAYRCGKVAHLYRPYAVDAAGRRAWGALQYDEAAQTLTMTFEAEWLANATYPVVVDPTIGYTSVGGSTTNVVTYVSANHDTLGATGGTTTAIYVYCQNTHASLSRTTDLAMYTDDAGNNRPQERMGSVVQITLPGPTSAGWQNVAYTQAVTGSTKYWLAHNETAAEFLIAYDSADADRHHYYAASDLPATWADSGSNNTTRLSIYADYTETAQFARPASLYFYRQLGS